MRNRLSEIGGSRWAVLIPMTIAGVLGISTIGSKSFWLDEAFSAGVIRLPTFDLLRYMWRNEQQASPYYLALQPWSGLGYDEATLRLLSVVFGVAGVAAMFAVGRRYGVGLPAALLLAVSPYFIHYEQETRVYTLLVAWSLVCTLAFLRLVERPDRWRAATYILAAAVLIYVHPLTGWILIAHAVVTILFLPRPWRWRLLAVYIPVAIASLPMLRFMAINHARVDWIPPTTIASVGRTFLVVSGGVALAIALTMVIAIGLWRRRAAVGMLIARLAGPHRSDGSMLMPALLMPTLLVLWPLLLIGGVLLMSFALRPLWVDRYLIGILPPLLIITAVAVRSLPWRWPILGVLMALSLLGVRSWYGDATKDNWRDAVAYVEASAQPTDGVIIWPNYYRIPFAYYGSVGEPLYPSAPWSVHYMPFLGMDIDLPADADNNRVWLVRGVTFLPSAELAAFLAQYETVETRVFGATQPQIDLLVRRP